MAKSAKLCRVCKCLLLTEGTGRGWPPIAIAPEPSSADDQMVPPVPIAFGGIKDTRGRKSMTDNLGVNYEFEFDLRRARPGHIQTVTMVIWPVQLVTVGFEIGQNLKFYVFKLKSLIARQSAY